MTGFSEGAIHLWNAATGEPRGEPLQLENKASTMDWTADGKRLVFTDANRNVTVWDSDSCKKLHEFKHDSPLLFPNRHLSPDGKWFACKGLGGELKVWDVERASNSIHLQVLPSLQVFFSARTRRISRRSKKVAWSSSGTLPPPKSYGRSSPDQRGHGML